MLVGQSYELVDIDGSSTLNRSLKQEFSCRFGANSSSNVCSAIIFYLYQYPGTAVRVKGSTGQHETTPRRRTRHGTARHRSALRCYELYIAVG